MPVLKKIAVGLVTGALLLMSVPAAQAADTTPMDSNPGPVGDFAWKGFNWEKRSWSGAPMYNQMFDKNNVTNPDANGYVTLNLTNPTGSSPVGAEFNTTRHGGWGYGTYSTTVAKNLNLLQKEVVWGCLFSYDPDAAPGYSEIDLCEASAWGGGASYGQSWPVTQGHGYWFDATKPPGEGNNTTVFNATDDQVLTHKMVWEPGRITFETYAGESYTGTLLKRTVLEGSTVPVPSSNTTLHFNLWVTPGGGGDPNHVSPESVTVRDFSYSPQTAPAPTSNPSIKSGADILGYDAGGTLWDYGTLAVAGEARRSIGQAAVAPKSFFVTDWNVDGIQDMVVQDQDGKLILRQGRSSGGFTDILVGDSGWQPYDIAVGKWNATDKYPSIIARNTNTGDLFVYTNTSGVGLAAPVKVGAGWQGYTPLNLVDWDRDGAIDVLARNASGEMKLYRTNGAGVFISEVRQTIGTGWNVMNHIRSALGRDGADTVGITARDTSGNLFYYPVNKSSWGARKTVGVGWSAYTIAGN
ncbi:hypothetical protein [Paenarthrobacter sp. C1]|uniref:hypothetical protein n=1 Tax=Paenarthrobacter sp. C1 TaxID=3400220 RepID=UPI003BF5FF6C